MFFRLIFCFLACIASVPWDYWNSLSGDQQETIVHTIASEYARSFHCDKVEIVVNKNGDFVDFEVTKCEQDI